MHKYSESKNSLGQIDQSRRTRKELETAHVEPLRAALGNCSHVFLCAQLPTAGGRIAVSNHFLCQMPLTSKCRLNMQNLNTLIWILL